MKTRIIGDYIVRPLVDLLWIPALLVGCLLARRTRKPIDVGLGPDPLINNVYHKKGLLHHGYTAETFIDRSNYITDKFDYHAGQEIRGLSGIFRPFVLFLRVLMRYRILYFYFNGGPLRRRPLLSVLEPMLFHLAGTRIVVMPYGSDVQELTRSRNPMFIHAMARDYPRCRNERRKVANRIDRWTRHADHVIAGCEWVDYMYYWDTLMLAHFSIDTEQPPANPADAAGNAVRPLRLLHAPNHRNIKGSEHFIRAVRELNEDGVAVELVILEGVHNDEVRKAIEDCDAVCDQLIIGWYAMFALEAMASGKPVICYLRPDLKDLYATAGLVEPGELPIVEASVLTVKQAIEDLARMDRAELASIGERSRAFVEKHHSTHSVGAVFAEINRSIGVAPSAQIGTTVGIATEPDLGSASVPAPKALELGGAGSVQRTGSSQQA